MADPVLEAMDAFAGPLSKLTREAQQTLLSTYRSGWQSISAELEGLTAKVASAPTIATISGTGQLTQGIPPSWTFQQERYIALQGEVRSLVTSLEGTLIDTTKAGQIGGWDVGGKEALAAGSNLAEMPISSWAKTPTGAFQAFVGGATSGPLSSLLGSFAVTNGPQAAIFARDVLGAGLLRGRSAFAIADDLNAGLRSISYSRALTIARTETLRAYREGARQSYLANRNIVQSWTWRAAVENQERPPCAACFARHGSVHPLAEPMQTHPNCRCRMVPMRSPILGVRPNDPVLPDAKTAFDALKPAQQRRILGPTRLEMYRSGRVNLSDFATTRTRGLWGANAATVRPLSELRTLSSQSRALPGASDRLFRQAARAEPEVSAVLQKLGTRTGAELEGFGFRLKAPDRIAEKIRADVLDGKGSIVKVSEGINDALRYTYRLEPGAYAKSVAEIMRGLQAEGMTVLKTKNFWQAPSGYRGYHAIFQAPNGARFELQFHTARSLAVKEKSHLLYEIQRLPTTSAAERLRLQGEIDDLWATLKAPRGVKSIADDWPPPTIPRIRTFETEDEAIRYFDALYRKPGADREALQDYTGGGFRPVNEYLRGGEDAIRTRAAGEFVTKEGVEAFTAENVALAQREIAAIERSMVTLEEDVLVFRGVRSTSAFGKLLPQAEEIATAERLEGLTKLVGQTIEEKGFLSTTVDEGVGVYAVRPVKLHITVPAGTRGSWMRPHSFYAEEDELLLESGLRYVITRVETSPNTWIAGVEQTVYDVFVTVLPKVP